MVAFVGATGGTTGSAGPVVTLHEDIEVGDLLLMFVGINSPAYTYSAPPGWVELAKVNSTGGSAPPYTVIFWKTAAASDAEASVQVPVLPTGSKQAVCVAAYRGSLLTPLIDVYGIEVPSTASTDLELPDLTTTQDDAILVLGGMRKGGTTGDHEWVLPDGVTQRALSSASGGGAISLIVGDIAQPVAGPISLDPLETNTSNTAGSAFLVAIYEGELPPMKRPIFRRFTEFGWYPPREGTESAFFS